MLTGRLISDPRLDPYRDRVARLSRDGAPCGYLLVSIERVTTRVGGHLWWTRWSPPREFVMCEVALGESGAYETSDFWVDRDLEEELARWGDGWLHLRGKVYTLAWLTVAESLPIAREVFGIVGFVHGQVDELGTGAPIPPMWRADQLHRTPTSRDDVR